MVVLTVVVNGSTASSQTRYNSSSVETTMPSDASRHSSTANSFGLRASGRPARLASRRAGSTTRSPHSKVTGLADGGESSAPAPVEAQAPAVSIRKSVTPDYLICLDDGKQFKSLRRHLTALGLTPHQYREKWKLPADYPMVAANYAAQRSEMAKKIGLGQNRKKAVAVPPAIASERKTGRRRKAAAESTAS